MGAKDIAEKNLEELNDVFADIINVHFEQGGVTMCDVVERIRNEGRSEGRDEGKNEVIINLIESNAGSIEQIAAWVKLPVNEVEKLAKKVPVHA